MVQCYGGAPLDPTAPTAIGRARFREFGGASVVALGLALSVGDLAGLLVALSAALVTVGLRLWLYRRLGGLTGRLITAAGEVVETTTLALLGAAAWAMR